jgi:hypothetical protein
VGCQIIESSHIDDLARSQMMAMAMMPMIKLNKSQIIAMWQPKNGVFQ